MTHDIVTEFVDLESRLVTDYLFLRGRVGEKLRSVGFSLPLTLGEGRKSPGNEVGGGRNREWKSLTL